MAIWHSQKKWKAWRLRLGHVLAIHAAASSALLQTLKTSGDQDGEGGDWEVARDPMLAREPAQILRSHRLQPQSRIRRNSLLRFPAQAWLTGHGAGWGQCCRLEHADACYHAPCDEDALPGITAAHSQPAAQSGLCARDEMPTPSSGLEAFARMPHMQC